MNEEDILASIKENLELTYDESRDIENLLFNGLREEELFDVNHDKLYADEELDLYLKKIKK